MLFVTRSYQKLELKYRFHNTKSLKIGVFGLNYALCDVFSLLYNMVWLQSSESDLFINVITGIFGFDV
jgi:hypothetical protein